MTLLEMRGFIAPKVMTQLIKKKRPDPYSLLPRERAGPRWIIA